MIRFFTAILIIAISLFAHGQERPLGVNLTDVSPFGTLWYYTNVLKQSSGWLVYNEANESDPINLSSELTARALNGAFDEQGYPVRVPFQVPDVGELQGKSLIASCLVLNGQPESYPYPDGEYLLRFQGRGVIAVQGDVDGQYVEFNSAGDHMVPISNPSSIGLQLFMLESDESDPIREVALIAPGYHQMDPIPRFQDRFLEIADQFDVLRFMKPLKSENNTIVDYDDRSTRADFSYFLDVENSVLRGMPYEDVIEISNLSQIDPWITIPYLASDDYARSAAALFERDLDEHLLLHIEYSNETWNPAYPATRAHMLTMGEPLATSDIPEVAEFEAIHRFHALRSLEIWAIFTEVFEGDTRLLKVHGSQSDPFTADLVNDAYQLETVNPDGVMPDMVAIASYIGVTLFDDLREQNLDICDHTPQQLLDTLINRIQPELREMLSRYQELFGSSGIEVVAYEGGQHVTELNFQPMEPCAALLVAEMNRLSDMSTFFCELLDSWYDEYGGGLFNVFNLAESPDDFGAFGILESQWQNPADAPKWDGVFHCLQEIILHASDHQGIRVFPNPASHELFIQSKVSLEYRLNTLSGKVIQSGVIKSGENQLDLNSIPQGLYILRIQNGTDQFARKISIQR